MPAKKRVSSYTTDKGKKVLYKPRKAAALKARLEKNVNANGRRRSAARDRAFTASTVFTQDGDPANIERWWRNPERFDIKGIDDHEGKAPSSRSSKSEGKPTEAPKRAEPVRRNVSRMEQVITPTTLLFERDGKLLKAVHPGSREFMKRSKLKAPTLEDGVSLVKQAKYFLGGYGKVPINDSPSFADQFGPADPGDWFRTITNTGLGKSDSRVGIAATVNWIGADGKPAQEAYVITQWINIPFDERLRAERRKSYSPVASIALRARANEDGVVSLEYLEGDEPVSKDEALRQVARAVQSRRTGLASVNPDVVKSASEVALEGYAQEDDKAEVAQRKVEDRERFAEITEGMRSLKGLKAEPISIVIRKNGRTTRETIKGFTISEAPAFAVNLAYELKGKSNFTLTHVPSGLEVSAPGIRPSRADLAGLARYITARVKRPDMNTQNPSQGTIRLMVRAIQEYAQGSAAETLKA